MTSHSHSYEELVRVVNEYHPLVIKRWLERTGAASITIPQITQAFRDEGFAAPAAVWERIETEFLPLLLDVSPHVRHTPASQ